MHVKKILLVGAGNIGKRYLESFAELKFDVDITVVDTCAESLESAKQSIEKLVNSTSVLFLDELAKVRTHYFDMVIVATGSQGREEIVKKISLSFQIGWLILEKVVCQSQLALREVARYTELLSQHRVLVNTPRRAFDLYRKLRAVLQGDKFDAVVSGGNWGLTTNGLHFIDVISWLLESRVNYCSLSSCQWRESKRDGYVECTGEMSVTFECGSTLTMISTDTDEQRQFNLFGSSDWRIDEYTGTVLRGKSQVVVSKIPLHSQFFREESTRILTTGTSLLPTFCESREQHQFFLGAVARTLSNDEYSEAFRVRIT